MAAPWDGLDEAYRTWLLEDMTSEEYNKLGPVDRRTIRTQFQQQQQPSAFPLQTLIYHCGARNGVSPGSFQRRVVVNEILGLLPESLASFNHDGSKLRCLCYGPPGSGKTSIMGKLDEVLRARFPTIPVYFVRCGELKGIREQLTNQLTGVPTCVVLADDVQEWYDFGNFFALFKGTNRLLVAAATYSVEQFNPQTPVEFQVKKKSNLTKQEASALLSRLNVDQEHHDDMIMWFGDNYGRFHLLVPTLLQRWNELKATKPDTTLAEAFFRAETMEDPVSGRLIPHLSTKMREILKLCWMGKMDTEQSKKLERYGVFDEHGQWSCEYVRRKYFRDIFHVSRPDSALFEDNPGSLPTELNLLKKGFEELNWAQLKMCAGSSTSGFPIEDIWQAEFYGSIGQFIPRELTFCKEHVVAQTDNRVDFVLRNGSTRAIEFLTNSRDVAGHHIKFENGSYRTLRLSGTYLVVDIKPWDSLPELHDVSNGDRLDTANACFTALASEKRRRHHAVFLISNDLSSGILYAYDATTKAAVEFARSPPPRDMDISE